MFSFENLESMNCEVSGLIPRYRLEEGRYDLGYWVLGPATQGICIIIIIVCCTVTISILQA